MTKLMLRSLAVALLLMLPAWAAAHARPAAQHPASAVALRAGRLLDVRSGRTLTDQIIIIENQRIVSITPAAQAQVPPGAIRVELPDLTVMPGLIDAHTHLRRHP